MKISALIHTLRIWFLEYHSMNIVPRVLGSVLTVRRPRPLPQSTSKKANDFASISVLEKAHQIRRPVGEMTQRDLALLSQRRDLYTGPPPRGTDSG